MQESSSTTGLEAKQGEPKYFTVKEANAMIPQLEAVFMRLLQMHAQIRTIYTRLSEQGMAPEDEEFDLEAVDAPEEIFQDLASLRVLLDAVYDELAQLRTRGCIVKSIENGLVDWYARFDGRDVLLCWKLGEAEVAWWHELDTGFAGRRPVSELEE